MFACVKNEEEILYKTMSSVLVLLCILEGMKWQRSFLLDVVLLRNAVWEEDMNHG